MMHCMLIITLQIIRAEVAIALITILITAVTQDLVITRMKTENGGCFGRKNKELLFSLCSLVFSL